MSFQVKLYRFAKKRNSTAQPPEAAPVTVSGNIKEGDEVKAGTELVIIEAMKMQNMIKQFKGGELKVTPPLKY
mgnify:CR=1 FL=1